MHHRGSFTKDVTTLWLAESVREPGAGKPDQDKQRRAQLLLFVVMPVIAGLLTLVTGSLQPVFTTMIVYLIPLIVILRKPPRIVAGFGRRKSADLRED
jgi:membrane protein YqaA with SNARE-associated domain